MVAREFISSVECMTVLKQTINHFFCKLSHLHVSIKTCQLLFNQKSYSATTNTPEPSFSTIDTDFVLIYKHFAPTMLHGAVREMHLSGCIVCAVLCFHLTCLQCDLNHVTSRVAVVLGLYFILSIEYCCDEHEET